jgi:quercetin dioxygenase-like cupin family protein
MIASCGDAPARHLINHLDEILEYRGDASYAAKRLVAYPNGASGYAHATLLRMPPRTKVLTHWHDDREAIFYCKSGTGALLLDGDLFEAAPGSAMLQRRLQAHGVVAGDETFEVLDIALFLATAEMTERADGRFVARDGYVEERTAYGRAATPFPPAAFSNPAVTGFAELTVAAGRALTAADLDPESEHILFVLAGDGVLSYLGGEHPLREGHVAYLVAGTQFALAAASDVVALCVSTLPGRIEEPPWFNRLRELHGRRPTGATSR